MIKSSILRHFYSIVQGIGECRCCPLPLWPSRNCPCCCVELPPSSSMKQKDNVTFYFYRPYIDSFFSLVYILLSLPSQLYLLLYLFIMHCVRPTFSHPRYLVPNWVIHLLLSPRTYFSCFYMVHPSFFFL